MKLAASALLMKVCVWGGEQNKPSEETPLISVGGRWSHPSTAFFERCNLVQSICDREFPTYLKGQRKPTQYIQAQYSFLVGCQYSGARKTFDQI